MKSAFGFYAYGHAAGRSFEEACQRALVELTRHEWAIKYWNELGSSMPPSNAFEARSLFFSTAEGHALFTERISAKAENPTPSADVVCDAEIVGP
jgi:hypothetical protein